MRRPAKTKIGERTVPQWLSFAVTAVTVGALLCLELRRPLRLSVESKFVRDARNLAVGLAGSVVVGLIERPLALATARRVERKRLGLLKQAGLPRWLETLLAVALLDYTLYLWHYCTHRIPFLWRFHVVHHVDLDLDVSTALRFHFGELLFSAPVRALQVRAIGVSPRALSLWQTLLLPEVMFHHANIELPIAVERRLSRFVVTPRLHGIHHSIVRAETNSNWSSGLTVWDWLHKTLRTDVPQQAITIGVPAYRAADEVTLPKLAALPFTAQRPTWQLPERLGGDRPVRRGPPADGGQLRA